LLPPRLNYLLTHHERLLALSLSSRSCCLHMMVSAVRSLRPLRFSCCSRVSLLLLLCRPLSLHCDGACPARPSSPLLRTGFAVPSSVRCSVLVSRKGWGTFGSELFDGQTNAKDEPSSRRPLPRRRRPRARGEGGAEKEKKEGGRKEKRKGRKSESHKVVSHPTQQSIAYCPQSSLLYKA